MFTTSYLAAVLLVYYTGCGFLGVHGAGCRTPCCYLYQGPKTTVQCRGHSVTAVPQHLPLNTTDLVLSDTAITNITTHAFGRYLKLEQLTIRQNALLSHIYPYAFNAEGLQQPPITVLTISGSPELRQLTAGALATFTNLDTLRLTRNGLEDIPNFQVFQNLRSTGLMEMDLSANNIKKIRSGAFQYVYETYELRLQYNPLTTIENGAFTGSGIAYINLMHNPQLTDIQADAFANATGLEKLDLSYTSIRSLPSNGLNKIKELIIKEVPSLKVFPPVLRFATIERAELTYSQHCCAFKHPKTQYPEEWRRQQVLIDKECRTVSPTMSSIMTSPLPSTVTVEAHRRTRVQDPRSPLHRKNQEMSQLSRHRRAAETEAYQRIKEKWQNRALIQRLRGQRHRRDSWHSSSKEKDGPQGDGGYWMMGDEAETGHHFLGSDIWHTSTLNPNETATGKFLCGDIVGRISRVNCTPIPDAFNPCTDVMGYEWLRVICWIVALTALLGNLIVLIVTLSSRQKITVSKFLMCNLSSADFLLGVYLLMLAAKDMSSQGVYFSMSIPWQYEGGCQAAGFITIFGSQLSIYTLTVITLERWYAISHAIHLTKRLRLRQASLIMIGGWLYAMIMAMLPLLGVSGYETTSICLPMRVKNVLDQGYVIALLVLNALAFIVIFACYLDMFCKVRGNNTTARSNDATIAKRMAILVFTDFVCFFPIAFFAFTASIGHPLIDITNSKILLVFFYPLNSCANPFLYAVFTKQFKKDFFTLTSRHGFFTKQAQKWRGTGPHSVYSHSQPLSSTSRNNSMAMQNFVHRPSDGSILTQYTSIHRGSKPSLGFISPNHTPESVPKMFAKKMEKAPANFNVSTVSPGDSPVNCPRCNSHNPVERTKGGKESCRLSVVQEFPYSQEDEQHEAGGKRANAAGQNVVNCEPPLEGCESSTSGGGSAKNLPEEDDPTDENVSPHEEEEPLCHPGACKARSASDYGATMPSGGNGRKQSMHSALTEVMYINDPSEDCALLEGPDAEHGDAALCCEIPKDEWEMDNLENIFKDAVVETDLPACSCPEGEELTAADIAIQKDHSNHYQSPPKGGAPAESTESNVCPHCHNTNAKKDDNEDESLASIKRRKKQGYFTDKHSTDRDSGLSMNGGSIESDCSQLELLDKMANHNSNDHAGRVLEEEEERLLPEPSCEGQLMAEGSDSVLKLGQALPPQNLLSRSLGCLAERTPVEDNRSRTFSCDRVCI